MNPLAARRMRALTERECYLRLHGHRSGFVRFVGAERAPVATDAGARADATTSVPALHLVFSYPRSGGRMSGEDVRLELLRRMNRRSAA